MSYQNINQYNFKRWYFKPLNEITDICLASDEKNYDEEVIFSPYLIAQTDGERMPLKFDFSSSGTVSTTYFGDFDYDTIVSENYWNPENIDLLTCGVKTEICNAGLTGIDNGLVKKFSGETIELNTGLYSGATDKFSRYKYDRRFKMHPITGFTTSENRIYNDDSYTYNLELKNDDNSVGNYIKFDGGFYQGFYKVFGYDYEVLPERYNLGWTTEFLLRYRWTGDTNVGLNFRYPENKGTFFYYGARAENKFYHYAAGSPASDTGYTRVTQYLNCLKTCECYISGYTGASCQFVYQQSGGTTSNCSCGQCPCNCTVSYEYPELDPLYDGVSNAMSLRLSGDTGSPKLCIKTYRITGGCETTGSCVTGITYTTGTSVTEWCSTRGIFDDCTGTTYSNEERWVQIDAVFERNTYMDDCDLEYKGGLKLVVIPEYLDTIQNNSVALIEPPLTQEVVYDPAKVEIVVMNERWLKERDYRLGSLKFYINGKLFLVVGGFEEIIPRPLNGWKETQFGVSYNISLGGGTQGLHDNLTVTGCADNISSMVYQQDPECLTTEILDLTSYSGLSTNIKLEEYFGGSFNGDISAFRMYSEPLNAGQIIHNFKLLKNKYGLLNPFCLNCNDNPEPIPNPPTPSITPTNTSTPTNTITNTPTITETPILSNTPTPSTTPTMTPTTSITPSNTSTPNTTPTNTPSPGTPPFTGYGFNLVNSPYSPPSSGNTIFTDFSSGGTVGLTNPNTFVSNGVYWSYIDNQGINRLSFFSGLTVGNNLVSFTHDSNSAIYSANSSSFFFDNENLNVFYNPFLVTDNLVLLTSSSVDFVLGEEVQINFTAITTPIPTQTQTPTATPTLSNTPTNTETPTPTITSTLSDEGFLLQEDSYMILQEDGYGLLIEFPSVTPTPTTTETPTETPTNTPTMTETPTLTPSVTTTETETPTPTVTASETPTITPTNTITSTNTPSITPTNTITPTITPSSTSNIDGFVYSDFASTTGLSLLGNASVSSNILNLTTAINGQVGNVYRTTAIKYDRNFSAQWSTFIGGGTGADGYCIQWTSTNNSTGTAGGGVGLIQTVGTINAVTFLTFTNNSYNWYKNNVLQSTDTVTAGLWRQTLYFWGDYNHSSQTFSLYWNTTNSKPVSPNKTFTSFSFDTGSYYMGFGAATGGSNDNHQLINWSLQFT